jgi:hypothetical protein
MAHTNGEIPQLIADLTCNDVLKCQNARRALVKFGEQAVQPLEKALHHKDHWVHWEAAKALGQIGSPRAIDALLEILDNKEFELRWLAAEGLSAIGEPAVAPLLTSLMKNPQSVWLQQSAHHVLLDAPASLAGILGPVIRAIEGPDPSVRIPIEAAKALDLLRLRAVR